MAQPDIPADEVISSLSNQLGMAAGENAKLSVGLSRALARIDVLETALIEKDQHITELSEMTIEKQTKE